MSAYMKTCWKLQQLSIFSTSSVSKSGLNLQSATVQLQFLRGRKRSTHPAPWFVEKKNKNRHFQQQELTKDNKDFLRELVLERYANQHQSPLKEELWERHAWTAGSARTGVLAVKIGSIPQWTKDGKQFGTTLLQVIDNHVIRYTPPEEFAQTSGYKGNWKRFGSVVVGALSSDPMLYTKEYNNMFLEAGVPPKRKLTRFLVTPDAAIQPGTPLYATHFRVGDYVDVQAKTIGHGFQGVVKRYGFKGGPNTHGNTKFHRRTGSISSGRTASRVRKGKRMPGHMGMDWRHHRGLKIWRINTKLNILYIHGSTIPGPNHCYVRVFDSILRNRQRELADNPPFNPTFYEDFDSEHELPEEILHKDLFHFSDPSLTLEDEKV